MLYNINANDSRRHNMQWNDGYHRYALSLNKYQNNQYSINWFKFKGVYKSKNHRGPQNKILGKGTYKDNIRIGKWVWNDMKSNKVILKGEYNDDGKPINVWEESDPRDENNLIITTYSDEGKVISVSKKTITYSSK